MLVGGKFGWAGGRGPGASRFASFGTPGSVAPSKCHAATGGSADGPESLPVWARAGARHASHAAMMSR